MVSEMLPRLQRIVRDKERLSIAEKMKNAHLFNGTMAGEAAIGTGSLHLLDILLLYSCETFFSFFKSMWGSMLCSVS